MPAYIIFKNMRYCPLISALETLLLGLSQNCYSWTKMFEEIEVDAAKMLVLFFWVTIASVMISGALWVRAYRKAS